ncbi:ABC transporter substrate-binding protein [Desulfovulcanus sp.]
MRTHKYFIFFLIFFISLKSGFAGETRTIIDARGRTIQISLPIRRVVVLNSNALEVMQILRAEDLVVGVSDYIHQKPQLWSKFQDRPVVGHWNEPDYELIATLRPDLVLCYGRFPGLETEQKLEPLGIQVLRLDFYKTSILPREVEILGDLLGRQKQAKTFLQWHAQKLVHIEKLRRKMLPVPRVYVESFSDYQVMGPGSGGYELSIFAGARNIASVLSTSFSRITPEWVLSKNPDIIVKITSLKDAYVCDNSTKFQRIQKNIMQRPGWNFTRAVRQGKVYVLASDVAAGPRAVVGIAYMAKWFFPEADLNPQDIHREYLEDFLKIPYRGFYAYPAGE